MVQLTSVKKKEEVKVENSIESMIDRLVGNAQTALKELASLDQKQIDEIVKQMALGGLDQHMPLAKMAVEETKRGVYEDKIIKNLFSVPNISIIVSRVIVQLE